MMRYICVLCFLCLFPFAVHAACSNPAGAEGKQVYNTTYKTMQFCDGTNWIAMKGGALDVLGSLNCTDGQIPKWNNGTSAWECAADIDTDTDTGVVTEADPTVAASVKDGVSWDEISGNTINVTNVNAAKVTATGVVKVGTQSGCAAGDSGAIRYVGGAVPFEYCDGGGSWAPFRQPACGDNDTAGCYVDLNRAASDPQFAASNIRTGTNILGVTGSLTVASPTCTNNSTAQCTLSASRASGDPDFIAANIADGVTILGVTGTLVAGGGGGASPPLHNGNHTEADCVNNGGAVDTISGNKICNYSLTSCPANWVSYAGYNKTSGRSCSSSCNSCSSGGHSAWGTGVESCTYRSWLGRSCGKRNTCSASVTNVACY